MEDLTFTQISRSIADRLLYHAGDITAKLGIAAYGCCELGNMLQENQCDLKRLAVLALTGTYTAVEIKTGGKLSDLVGKAVRLPYRALDKVLFRDNYQLCQF
ncbi:hypothetical protein KY332_04500 [Candidatus Woesearchaeota archaeon]|nr:hypothetical protein [Candidatus Woesearchaeota archaeon]